MKRPISSLNVPACRLVMRAGLSLQISQGRLIWNQLDLALPLIPVMYVIIARMGMRRAMMGKNVLDAIMWELLSCRLYLWLLCWLW